MSGRSNIINKVFYATSYHPIQAGSIDGTDVLPHDNAVRRALLCSNAGLYDPFGDPKVSGDPYCTVFVGRLSPLTTEDTLREAMSKFGRIKSLRLVRHIVTGASRGYAFVEYETERETRRAYEGAHHFIIGDHEIIVDYNRQQLMPGWIPRRLGGGLGGRKESGQLRFGGRERPFRAPLRPIPHEDLKRLGIPPPPEGRYMSRSQVPSPPRRKRSAAREDRCYPEREEFSDRSSPAERGESYQRRHSHAHSSRGRHAEDREEHNRREIDSDMKEPSWKRKSRGRGDQPGDKQEISDGRSSYDTGEQSHKRHKHRRFHQHRRSSREDHHSSD